MTKGALPELPGSPSFLPKEGTPPSPLPTGQGGGGSDQPLAPLRVEPVSLAGCHLTSSCSLGSIQPHCRAPGSSTGFLGGAQKQTFQAPEHHHLPHPSSLAGKWG